MIDWQRKRDPQDVPTPVAVAVADYCRRAKAPASPGRVRDALAFLEDSDDVRVRQITDAEPEARLGPFALVDVILGTEAAVAAQREQAGYYELGRKRAEENAKVSPQIKLTAPQPKEKAAPQRPVPSAPRVPTRSSSKGKAAVNERIAPRKRKAGEKEEVIHHQPSLRGSAFLPKRNLPAPRGRFTNVDPSRANFESLFRRDGKEIIEALIEQVPHRVAMLRALEQGYIGRRGQTLSVGDVEDVLEEHQLFERIEKKERVGLLAAVIENKGSLGRSAHGFGLTVEELETLIGALGVDREVDEVRDRFVKDALSAENLSLRLDLLFRSRYLEDLGIERTFQQGLTRQLEKLVSEVKDAAPTVPTLVDLLARRHALHAEGLRRALDKLGLLEPWLKNMR